MSARFSEREFEFCFNAEFVRKHRSALIGTPIIPSQRMENVLGYDVEFRLKNGQFTRSLFLQHKVSSYAEHRTGRNASIWDCYNGPYYRFPVERLDKTRQHNLLVDLAQKGEDVFYCAPIFVGSDNLQTHFVRNQVMEKSRFFSPSGMGMLADFDQHHVSCDPTGTFGFFHSEARKLDRQFGWVELLRVSVKRRVDLHYAEGLLQHLSASVKKVHEAMPTVPDAVSEKGTVVTISYMLRRYFNVVWLIMGEEDVEQPVQAEGAKRVAP